MRKRSVTIWVMVVVVCLGSSKVMGRTQFRDGQTYYINYLLNDDVWVDYQSPGLQTKVNWLDGASMQAGYELRAYEDGRISFFGGSINTILQAFDNSWVDISGGLIYEVDTYESSRLDIAGGLISWDLEVYASSQVNILGGRIGFDLWTYDKSEIIFSGGSVGDEIRVLNESVLTIHGSDFLVDGKSIPYGELTSISGEGWKVEPHRRLTGVLDSGELISNDFYICHDGKIVLVPEPTTLLLLGLGALMLRRNDFL